LFLVHKAGGIAGIVFVTGVVSAGAILAAFRSRPVGTPAWIAIAVWIPALFLAGTRFPVRPETLTLLFVALFLCVLFHLDEHPRRAWLLVPLQLLWVNTHGLFVFGPILLSMRLLERLIYDCARALGKGPLWTADDSRWWRHVGGASVLAVLVCFLNPYGARGAFFPLVLYPKVTGADNVYKASVGEFVGLREQIARSSPEAFVRQSPYWAIHFLWLILPVSFLLPSLAEAAAAALPGRKGELPRLWLAIFAGIVVLLAIHTYTLYPDDCPAWLSGCGRGVPWLIGLAGIAGGLLLAPYSRYAAALSAVSGMALALWMYWLKDYLVSPAASPAPSPIYCLVAGAAAVVMILPQRRCLFAVMIATAFSYLAITTINSLVRFSLVAGVILSWNLAPWLGRLIAQLPASRWQLRLKWSARALLACLLISWSAAVVSNRLPAFLNGSALFGFQESPLVFAHDAIRFAGQDGMPERALVYSLLQSGLYTYYNAPLRQAFIDPRLEVASEKTFGQYLEIGRALSEARPGWPNLLHELGDPVLFLTNDQYVNAQATVLASPDWRLVYHDALAAVFLPRFRPELEVPFPTLDLATRHFTSPSGPSEPADSEATWQEGKALTQLALALQRYPEIEWSKALPILLRAFDRVELALEQKPLDDWAWLALGNCYRRFASTLRTVPAPAADHWIAENSLPWAQMTYCLRRALDCNPRNRAALDLLYGSLGARGLLDAQLAIGQRLAELKQLPASVAADIERATRALAALRTNADARVNETVLDGLLRSQRPAEAIDLAARAMDQANPVLGWELTERLAGAAMHVGRPVDARRLWQNAGGAPSEAVRLCRLGDTKWVERDYTSAIADYEQAHRLDDSLITPCWALAWLQAQRGRGAASLAACEEALARNPQGPTRTALEALASLVRLHAKAPRSE
jgi:tetratricopeptide (TPR) repeat protein